MLDHIGIKVSDVGRSRDFYAQVLGAIGYRVLMEHSGSVGFGQDSPEFWISQKTPASINTHVAFRVNDTDSVARFYQAALDAGGKDNGAPGLRRPQYYAAFVFDPDGNNIEVVCRQPG